MCVYIYMANMKVRCEDKWLSSTETTTREKTRSKRFLTMNVWHDFAEKARDVTRAAPVFRNNNEDNKLKKLRVRPGDADSVRDADGLQHRGCSSLPLGRAQLMQILQGLCPMANSLAEFYKDLFVLGPLPTHGKPQNGSCHWVQLSWATWYYWLSRVAS